MSEGQRGLVGPDAGAHRRIGVFGRKPESGGRDPEHLGVALTVRGCQEQQLLASRWKLCHLPLEVVDEEVSDRQVTGEVERRAKL